MKCISSCIQAFFLLLLFYIFNEINDDVNGVVSDAVNTTATTTQLDNNST